MVNEETGANAINVFPGAAGAITNIDIDNAEEAIKNSKIFLTQLEAPKDTVMYAIKKAKDLGVQTILNPAPAADIDKSIFPFIDYFTPNETFSSPIANLSNPVVDTTGAGDAFNAGFAAALTEGQNIKDAISFASATAGLSTTKIGTANSMPSREEIDKIL